MPGFLVIYLDRFMGLCVPMGMSWCGTVEDVDQLPHGDMMLIYDLPGLRSLPWAPLGISFGEEIDMTKVVAGWCYDPASETWRRRDPSDRRGFRVHVKGSCLSVQMRGHDGAPIPFQGSGAWFLSGEAQLEFPITQDSVLVRPSDAHGLFVRLDHDTAGTIFSLEDSHEECVRSMA